MSSAPLLASQLDRIEDALEELELGGIPDAIGSATDEPTVAVATHLDAYRQILVLSRDALPMQDAPAGVLDAVLAEARAVAGVAGVPMVASALSASRELGWWDKFRANFWVPALGFAGAAALLLVVLRPSADVASEAKIARSGDVASAADAEPQSSPEPAAPPTASPGSDVLDGRFADADRLIGGLAGNGDAQGVDRGEGLLKAEDESVEAAAAKLDGERAANLRSSVTPSDEDTEATEEAEEDLKGLSDDAPAEMPAPPEKKPRPAGPSQDKKRKNTAPPSNKTAPPSNKTAPPSKEAPGVPTAPRPTPTKSSKGSGGADSGGGSAEKHEVALAKLGERGEARRRSGKCGLARLDFTKARGASDPNTRARALAGLGLCELAAGDEAAANSLFASARAADRTVATFIEQQRAKIQTAPPPDSRD